MGSVCQCNVGFILFYFWIEMRRGKEVDLRIVAEWGDGEENP